MSLAALVPICAVRENRRELRYIHDADSIVEAQPAGESRDRGSVGGRRARGEARPDGRRKTRCEAEAFHATKETARARSPIGTDSARTEYEEPERDQSRGGDAHGAREPERDRVEVD